MLVALKNSTQKLCVIGDPVLHSRSPLLQNTMISALGLDYVYLCQSVPRGGAAEWLRCARGAGYVGFNATMPHKQALLPLLDEVDGDAGLFGAVNTVCLRDGRSFGYNTDGQGFLRALAGEGIDPAGLRVVLLGAGGAAKAVALKLAQAGVARVTVCNRTAEKAAGLCALEERGILCPADFDGESLCRAAAECDLLVNCTSLGMDGGGGQFGDLSFLEALPRPAAVCDLIYSPAETALLAHARALGHRGMNGLGLLIHQAVLSLELFTGVELDANAMSALLLQALANDREDTCKKSIEFA